MKIALTHVVSPSISRCELTYLAREPIDFEKAVHQHSAYCSSLERAGARVIELTENSGHPDGCFVEDNAVVVEEVAVIASMGAASRRGEVEAVERVLSEYRPISRIEAPGSLEGGDVIVAGKRVFAGVSPRTNIAGIEELSTILKRHSYEVSATSMRDCLHLKSACTFIGDNTLLANPQWVDLRQFDGFRLLEIAESEAWAANALRFGQTVFMGSQFPESAEIVRHAGFDVELIDISELIKAEAGLTCSSIIFDA